MKHIIPATIICMLVIVKASAQTGVPADRGVGKTLADLIAWISPPKTLLLLRPDWQGKFTSQFAANPFSHRPQLPIVPTPAVDIPRWSSDDLPFFCKIEHTMGKKMPLLIKFRLGSVEYVDWLEGKASSSRTTYPNN